MAADGGGLSLGQVAALGVVVDSTSTSDFITVGKELVGTAGQMEQATKGVTSASREFATAQAGAAAQIKITNDVQSDTLSIGSSTMAMLRQKIALHKQEAAEANNTAKSADAEAKAFDRLRATLDPLYGVQQRLTTQTAALDAALKREAITLEQHAALTKSAGAAAESATVGLNNMGHASSTATREFLVMIRELSRGDMTRFAGSASIFAQAISSQGGGGLGGAFKAAGGLAAKFLPVLAALAVAVGGYALETRALNQDHKDLIDTLNLTDDQYAKVEHRTITMGDAFKGTWDYIVAKTKEGLAGSSDQFGDWLDGLTAWSENTGKTVLGFMVGAYRATTAVLSHIPESLADILGGTVDMLVRGIETMINVAIDKLNDFLKLATLVTHATGNLFAPMPQVGHIPVTGATNEAAGFMNDLGAYAGREFNRGQAAGQKAFDDIGGDLATSIQKAALKRMTDEAGPAAKESRGAKDDSNQRAAEIDKQLAAAKTAELQAQLALTGDIQARADIQRGIVDSETRAKVAEIDKQIGALLGDNGIEGKLSDRLQAELEGAKQTYANAAVLKKQAISRDAQLKMMEQGVAYEAEINAGSAKIATLRASLAGTAADQNTFEQQALDLRQKTETAQIRAQQASLVMTGQRTIQQAMGVVHQTEIAHELEQEAQGRQARVRLLQEEAQREQSLLETQVDLLQAQQSAAQFQSERTAIGDQLLQLDQKIAQSKAIEAVNQALITGKGLEEATAALAALPAKQKAQQVAAFYDKVDTLGRTFDDMGSALKDHDFGRALKGLFDGIDQLEDALANGKDGIAGAVAAISAVAGSIGKAIGGRTGSAIESGASGAAFGAQVGGAPGAVIGGIAGALGGLLTNAAQQTQAAIDAAKAATQAYQASEGSGTILGDISAKSDSIAKSLADANSTSIHSLGYASEMVTHLKSIDSSIGSFTSLLARQLGLSTGGAFDTSSLGLGTSKSSSFVPLLGLLGLFGKSTTTKTLTDQGLSFAPQTVGGIAANGVQGQSYQDIQTIVQKSIFGISLGSKTSTDTVFKDLSSDFSKQVDLIVGNVAGTVLSAARTLGIQGAEATIDAFNVDLGKISLDGLKGQDLQNAISAVFSTFADNLSASLDPVVTQLQAVGEGAFETLTRLATEYQAVDDILASMGKAFGQVGVASITARDNLVKAFGSIDAFSSSVSYFVDNFYTDQEKLSLNSASLTKNLQYLADTYGDQSIASLTTADAFKTYIQSIDETTTSGASLEAALLSLAPALKAVIDGTDQLATSLADPANNSVLAAVQDAQAALSALGLSDADNHSDSAKAAQANATAAATAIQAAADAFKTMSDSIDAAVPGLLKTGDVMGALAQRVQQVIGNPAYDRHAWTNADGSTNIAGLNADVVKQQATQARILLGQVDAMSISIPNATGAMRDLVDVFDRQFSPEFNQWAAQLGATSGILRGINGDNKAGGLYGAQDYLSFVGSSTTSSGAQSTGLGADVNDFNDTIARLKTEAAQGVITFDDMNAKIDALNSLVGPDFIKFAGDAAAQLARVNEAMEAVGAAGAAQVANVFGQIAAQVGALDTASAAANDTLSQTVGAIGRLKSESQLLLDGVQAAAGYGGDISNAPTALLISQAAGIAASVLTTADASAAAVKLAQSPAFANLTASGIRDASLLLDGVKANDAQSFENSFARINNALINGSVTQDQYNVLVNDGLDIFQGLSDAAGSAADALKDLATQLRLDDSVTALSQQQQLAVAAQQFNQSATLDTAKTYLGLLKDTATSAADYSVQFAQVVSRVSAPSTSAPRLGSDGQSSDAVIATLNSTIAELKQQMAEIAASNAQLVRDNQEWRANGLPTTAAT